MKRWVRWLWAHRWLAALLSVCLAMLLLNALAFMHAWAMTHFVSSGSRTVRPESLTFPQKLGVLLTGIRVPKPANVAPTSQPFAIETHRFPGGSGELEAWFVPCEQARGLFLLFHGYASCKSELLGEAAALRELGYHTLLVDFRGSGGSSGYETTVGMLEADDVARAYEYAQERWPGVPLFVFGQSMGATAVLRAMALRRLDPTAIILECPFDRLLSTVANRFHTMKLPAIPLAQLLVFWGGVQQGFNGFRHNPVDYARSVTVPTLMMHGACDTRVTLAQGREVADNLAGVHDFVVFEGLGHESFIASDREHWMRVVEEFLNRVR
jgi:alpha-beta hydrolase superfamily lysophospholipase